MPRTVKQDPAVAEIFGIAEAEQSWPVQCHCNTDIAKDFLQYSPGLVKLPGAKSSQAWICVVRKGPSFSLL